MTNTSMVVRELGAISSVRPNRLSQRKARAESRPRRTLRVFGRLSWTAFLIALTVAFSGCAVFSPVQTSYPYVQADGVALNIEGIEFENLVVVAPSRGAPGVLTGQAVNLTAHEIDVTVVIEGGSQPATFTLAPLTGDGITATPSNVDLGPVPVIPGALVNLIVSTPAAGENNVSVPVLPPGSELDYYDGIHP